MAGPDEHLVGLHTQKVVQRIVTSAVRFFSGCSPLLGTLQFLVSVFVPVSRPKLSHQTAARLRVSAAAGYPGSATASSPPSRRIELCPQVSEAVLP
jgi:hypothetical protein